MKKKLEETNLALINAERAILQGEQRLEEEIQSRILFEQKINNLNMLNINNRNHTKTLQLQHDELIAAIES